MEKLVSPRTALEAYLRRLSEVLPEPAGEEVPVERSLGRVAAEDVRAPTDLPPFDRAVMDGYAVRAEDTFGARPDKPVRLRLVGRALAGHPGPPVGPGECVEVSTGSMLPEGANAVIRYEHARELGGEVEIYQPAWPGSCVDRAGSDMRAGQVVVRKGQVIRPPELALLLSLGLEKVMVFRRPLLAVFSVGDELTDSPSPGRGRVRDVDRPLVALLAERLGAEVLDLGIVPDEVGAIRRAFLEGLSKCDAVLAIGGTSVGKPDLTGEALRGIEGIEVIAGRLSMRPGRPVILALAGRKPVICLPGPPVACYLAFQLFVRPVLLLLSGINRLAGPVWPVLRARLTRRLPSRVGFTDLVRVRLLMGPDGSLLAEPLAIRGSGLISSLARANGIVVVPEEVDVLEEGTEVDVLPIWDFELPEEFGHEAQDPREP